MISPASNNSLAVGSVVTMSCVDPGCVIFYTLDGSMPEQTDAQRYTAPIALRAGSYVVRAIVNATGYHAISSTTTAVCTCMGCTNLVADEDVDLVYGVLQAVSATVQSNTYFAPNLTVAFSSPQNAFIQWQIAADLSSAVDSSWRLYSSPIVLTSSVSIVVQVRRSL